MPFHAPVADQRFLLDAVVRIGELEGEGFPALSRILSQSMCDFNMQSLISYIEIK